MEFAERLKASIHWLSVQVTAVWGVIWVIYSQLPVELITTLSTIKIGGMSVVALMGIGQTITTYLARIKKAPPPPDAA